MPLAFGCKVNQLTLELDLEKLGKPRGIPPVITSFLSSITSPVVKQLDGLEAQLHCCSLNFSGVKDQKFR